MLARRVPVRTAASVSRRLALRFGSHGRPFEFIRTRLAARAADRVRRDAAGGGPADLHGPGRRRSRSQTAVARARRPAAVADAVAADHPAAARVRHAGPADARAPTPDRVATRVRIAAPRHRPAGRSRARPATRTCDVAMYLSIRGPQSASPGRAARRTSSPTPARACSCRCSRRKARRAARAASSRSGPATTGCFRYEIVEVRAATRPSLDDPLSATTEQLWLQTSEGPTRTFGKTQVIAMPLSVEPGRPRRRPPEGQARVARLRPCSRAAGSPRSSRSAAARPPRSPAAATITAGDHQNPEVAGLGSATRPRSSRRSRPPRRCRPG